MIAVGMGGGGTESESSKSKASASAGKDLTGVLRVYRNDTTFSLCYESKEAKKAISEIKFSPDGKTLAVGSHDNCIVFYNVHQQYKRRIKFNKHSSAILHFDFSVDGSTLQSNCQAYELLFCDAATGKQLTSSPVDTQWSTMTSRLRTFVVCLAYAEVLSVLCM